MASTVSDPRRAAIVSEESLERLPTSSASTRALERASSSSSSSSSSSLSAGARMVELAPLTLARARRPPMTTGNPTSSSSSSLDEDANRPSRSSSSSATSSNRNVRIDAMTPTDAVTIDARLASSRARRLARARVFSRAFASPRASSVASRVSCARRGVERPVASSALEPRASTLSRRARETRASDDRRCHRRRKRRASTARDGEARRPSSSSAKRQIIPRRAQRIIFASSSFERARGRARAVRARERLLEKRLRRRERVESGGTGARDGERGESVESVARKNTPWARAAVDARRCVRARCAREVRER